MKRLILLRHAKSDWDDPVARDFDRPLNARGMRAAQLMGDYARQQGIVFDHVVASPAVRVVETIDGFVQGYGRTIEPNWDRRIYLASSATLMDVIRQLPDGRDAVLMIGHNPGLEDLVLGLVADDGSNPLRDEVEQKLPTAAITVMDLRIDSWDQTDGDCATLLSFIRPRDLDPALGPLSR